MKKLALKNLILLTGIFVALIVLIIFNAAVMSSNAASIEAPVNPVNEIIYYAAPNVFIQLF